MKKARWCRRNIFVFITAGLLWRGGNGIEKPQILPLPSSSVREKQTYHGAVIPVFYNLYVSNAAEVPRVNQLVEEQLAFKLPEHQVFVNSIGTPMPITNTTLIAHHDDASEIVTLHSLWEHCAENLDGKVVYLHSKGSFHPSYQNDKIRRFLTEGALSKECADLPAACNVCSSRMSPIPHPHTSGNMWLARCSYIAKLMDPNNFQAKMLDHYGVGANPCVGTGRYAAEHWVNSHPHNSPCDLSTDKYVWNYRGVPSGNFVKELKLAPRYPMSAYVLGACSNHGQSVMDRLEEYQVLYNSYPTASWWGWKFFGFGYMFFWSGNT